MPFIDEALNCFYDPWVNLHLRSEKQFPHQKKTTQKISSKTDVKTEAGGLCFSSLRDLFTPGFCRAFAGLGLNSVTRYLYWSLLSHCDDTPWLRQFVEGRVCLGLQSCGVWAHDSQAEARRRGQEAKSSHLGVHPELHKALKPQHPPSVTWHTSSQPHQLGTSHSNARDWGHLPSHC